MPNPKKGNVPLPKAKTLSTGSAEAPGRRTSLASVSSKKSTSSDTTKSKTSSSSPSSAKAASTGTVDKLKREASGAPASSAKSDSTVKLDNPVHKLSSISAPAAKSTSAPSLDMPGRRKPTISAPSPKSTSAAKFDQLKRRMSSISASSGKSMSTSTVDMPGHTKSNISVSSQKSSSTLKLDKQGRRTSITSTSSAKSENAEEKQGKPVRPDATVEVDLQSMIPGDLSPTAPMLTKGPTTLKSFVSKNRYPNVMTLLAAKARKRWRVMTLLIATAILLSVLGGVLAWHIFSTEPPGKTVEVCLTVDCLNFGKEMSSAINHAADPCVDFHSYVCGTWDDPLRQWSTEGSMRRAAAQLALKEIEADRTQQSKATQLYQSCIRAIEHKEENLKAFYELRSSVGLFWPDHKNENIHPLDVMGNLAVNWDMNFLFDLSTVRMRNSAALLISRSQLDIGWELTLRFQALRENYHYYVEQHLTALGASYAMNSISAAELLSLETAIMNAKLGFLYDTPVQEWLSLDAIGVKAKDLPGSLWLSLLAKHDRQFHWTADSIVIIEDVKILDSLQKLLLSLTHDRLIIGLSWVFIQTHLWAVTGEPSIRFRGLSDGYAQLVSHGCVAYVESRFGLLSLWRTMNDRFGRTTDRLHVYSFLHRVNEHAKSLVNNLTWMEEKSKRMAFTKLDKMTRVILPGSKFFNKDQVELLYRVFPDMTGKTFMVNFLNASRVYRELRNHEHFEDIYSFRMFPSFGRELYLYLPNTMKLAFGNLEAPVFYNNATLAIRYGGLGSFAARQMVKAFDDVGVTVDETGKTHLWLGSIAATVHSEKSRCNVSALSGSRPLRLFPVIPGLELAFHGYRAAVARDFRALEDFKVIYLEEFTDDQIFFLTYCYTICTKRRQTGVDECNVPLKNFPPFAAAFHCAADLPMNPSRKCSFFSSIYFSQIADF